MLTRRQPPSAYLEGLHLNVHLGLIFSAILTVLVIDLWLPLGVAVWLLYVVPLWLASRQPAARTWLLPLTAVLCTVSIFIVFFQGPRHGHPLQLINRGLATLTLWVVTLLLLRFAVAQSALAAQAETLRHQRALLEMAHVMVREPEGRILAWSEGLEALYGYRKTEAVGENVHVLLKTRFPQPADEIEATLLRTSRWHGELVHRHKDGHPVVVASHWILQRDDTGRPVAVLEVNNDVTELKHAEEARRESEARFRVMADTVPDIIFTSEPDGRNEYINHRFTDYTGLPLEAGWMAAIHPDDLDRAAGRWRESLRTGMPYEMELRLKGKDERYRWFVGRARPIRNEQGRIMKWFGTCTDVHDLKEASEEVRRLLHEAEGRERELREKQAQLIQAAKLASLGELASGIAHELNNPLNNISLFLGNALDHLGAGRSADLQRALERALQQTGRAATIIKHLRTFARTATVHHEPVSLNEAILAALSLVTEHLRLREIAVELDLATPDPIVLGSRIQLEQVFLNLLSNARDALASVPAKRLRLATRVHGERVEVRIEDTGVGIPAEVQSRIFDPFFTTKSVGEGTGLGLSISYGIIEDHHGRISVESAEGRGTTFVIDLPLAVTTTGRTPASSHVDGVGATT